MTKWGDSAAFQPPIRIPSTEELEKEAKDNAGSDAEPMKPTRSLTLMLVKLPV